MTQVVRYVGTVAELRQLLQIARVIRPADWREYQRFLAGEVAQT